MKGYSHESKIVLSIDFGISRSPARHKLAETSVEDMEKDCPINIPSTSYLLGSRVVLVFKKP
jgi:hypothetical protein